VKRSIRDSSLRAICHGVCERERGAHSKYVCVWRGRETQFVRLTLVKHSICNSSSRAI